MRKKERRVLPPITKGNGFPRWIFMSKFSQNRTTQFDEVEEPKFKKKVKEKRKSSDNTFLEDFQKPNDHWANKKKNKDKHNRNYDDYDGWN